RHAEKIAGTYFAPVVKPILWTEIVGVEAEHDGRLARLSQVRLKDLEANGHGGNSNCGAGCRYARSSQG
ncbi:hypothetical protein ABTG32_18070, partial [Acinetobacter baumannii]